MQKSISPVVPIYPHTEEKKIVLTLRFTNNNGLNERYGKAKLIKKDEVKMAKTKMKFDKIF